MGIILNFYLQSTEANDEEYAFIYFLNRSEIISNCWYLFEYRGEHLDRIQGSVWRIEKVAQWGAP